MTDSTFFSRFGMQSLTRTNATKRIAEERRPDGFKFTLSGCALMGIEGAILG